MDNRAETITHLDCVAQSHNGDNGGDRGKLNGDLGSSIRVVVVVVLLCGAGGADKDREVLLIDNGLYLGNDLHILD